MSLQEVIEKIKDIREIISDLQILLESAAKEQVCPTCRGVKFLETNYQDHLGKKLNMPCPACNGIGTYRSWAEKQITDQQVEIDNLKTVIQENSDSGIKQRMALRIQYDNGIDLKDKQIGELYGKAVKLIDLIVNLQAGIASWMDKAAEVQKRKEIA